MRPTWKSVHIYIYIVVYVLGVQVGMCHVYIFLMFKILHM